MSLFYPDILLNSVTDITPEFLEKSGKKAIILDVDNTLTTHDNPVPADGVMQWIQTMKASSIKLIIVSNNSYERVKPFADMLGLDFISKGKKPLTIGNNKAIKKLGLTKNEVCLVGDQIFTDILGGKMAGIYSIMTVPIEFEKGFGFRFKRLLEKPILKLYKRKKR